MADVKSEDESSMCISDMNILKTRASEFTSSQASPQSDKKREQIKRRNQSSNAMNIMTLDSPNAWSALNSNCPVAESVHSALVSAVSKAEMTDLTESLAPKSIYTKRLAHGIKFLSTERFFSDSKSAKEYNKIPWCYQSRRFLTQMSYHNINHLDYINRYEFL